MLPLLKRCDRGGHFHYGGFRADKLSLARRLAVFEEHIEDLLQIGANLVLGGALRMRSRKTGDVADEQPRIGIALNDGYSLYLAYYYGHDGYAQGAWRGRADIQRSAQRVSNMALTYQSQLRTCGG